MKYWGLLILLIIMSCSDKSNSVQIGENTFVYNKKVYRVIENQLTELGSLNSDSIAKSEILSPRLKDYGINKLDQIKEGVEARLTGVYRGDVLYFKFELIGLNDLRDKYSSGSLTINFQDDFAFEIHATEVRIGELIGIVGANNQILSFEYNGKTKMSSDVYEAISKYSVSYSLREKSRYGW